MVRNFHGKSRGRRCRQEVTRADGTVVTFTIDPETSETIVATEIAVNGGAWAAVSDAPTAGGDWDDGFHVWDTKPLANGAYTIQIASMKDKNAADKMVSKLRSQGHPAFKTMGRLSNDQVWYRIRIGSYRSKIEAELQLQTIKKKYAGAIMVKR